jgi:hypothetical protein
MDLDIYKTTSNYYRITYKNKGLSQFILSSIIAKSLELSYDDYINKGIALGGHKSGKELVFTELKDAQNFIDWLVSVEVLKTLVKPR